jgi:hypothetical protein
MRNQATGLTADYSTRLAAVKADEKPEVVLLVADDPGLVKIAVAWSNTATACAEPVTQLKDESEGAVWDWLWENTRHSREELLSKVALSEREFERKWRILVGNRVVYPDGTVNTFVQRYLREKVLNLFGAKGKGAGKGK